MRAMKAEKLLEGDETEFEFKDNPSSRSFTGAGLVSGTISTNDIPLFDIY
jgi:hypothetical protein